MTPEIRNELLAIRDTKAAELEELRKALPALEAEAREAASVERLATNAFRERQLAIADVKEPEESLTTWLHEFMVKRDTARGNKTHATRCLGEARHKIRNAARDLAQLNARLGLEDTGAPAWGYRDTEEVAA